MKKLTLILLVLLLLVTGITASAQTEERFDTLANFVPADAIAFFGIRTDDAYIDALDGIFASIVDKFPEGSTVLAGTTFRTALDVQTRSFMNLWDDETITFENTIRPWWGNEAAATIVSIDSLNAGSPLTYIVEVTDMTAAAAFLDSQLVADDGGYSYYSRVDLEDGGISYVSDYSSDPDVLLTADKLFIGDMETGISLLLSPDADALRLPKNEDFQSAISSLPGENYNIVGYIALDTIVSAAFEMAANMGDMPPLPMTPDQIAAMAGDVGIGFTIMDDRSLVIDVATTGENPMMMEYEPVDLSMLERVPSETGLLLQMKGLGGQIQYLLDSLNTLNDYMTEMGVLPIPDAGLLSDMGPDDLGTFIRLAFEGTYKLNLEETLSWMNGDLLAFAGTVPAPDTMFGVSLEMGMLQATDNPEATAAFVAAIAKQAMNAFAPTTFEDGVLNMPLGQLYSSPDLLNITVTSNDEFLASGTTNAVNFALEPGEANITGNASFQFEQQKFLADPVLLWYADFAPVRNAFDAVLETGMIPAEPDDVAMVDALLSIVDTLSITAAQSDGMNTARFSLTLGQ